MNKKNSKLIDRVIAGIDWDLIFDVNKCFKSGVGEGAVAIPGIKRKLFNENLTKNDLKNELKSLLKHVIQNDIPELYYGSWMIFWSNSEWADNTFKLESEDPDEEMEIELEFELYSTLEAIYSPHRICVVDSSEKQDPLISINQDPDVTVLESMLRKAEKLEDYELASKIRDIINLQKSGNPGDK